MKTVKLFLSLVTVLLFCAALTACAAENKGDSAQHDVVQNVAVAEKEPIDDGGQAEREREAREHDKADDSDRLDPREEDMDDGGQAEREREAREHDERAEEERQKQEEERRQQEEQQEQQPSGSYEHQIGDAVFYTEHDLWKYISPYPTNPSHYGIDIQAMLLDVWGTNGGLMQCSDGYAFSDGSSFTMAVSYLNLDDNIANKRMVVSSGGEEQHRSVITSWNTPKPDGGYWIVLEDPRGFGLTPDMAAVLLYVLEQTISNPRSNIAGELGLPSNYECTVW